ncbi:hypothetical protein VNI00_018666 [Paramarasmius palmivorus]|uniref:Uncharacterized protein n=1 Tax=Paramarasmius palmivorus TaxID=297713 RepID=A0AAW0AWF4_9AGAR
MFPNLTCLQCPQCLVLGPDDTAQENLAGHASYGYEDGPDLEQLHSRDVLPSWPRVERLHILLTAVEKRNRNQPGIDYAAMPALKQLSVSFTEEETGYLRYLERLVLPRTVTSAVILMGHNWEFEWTSVELPPSTHIYDPRLVFACKKTPFFQRSSFNRQDTVQHLAGRVVLYENVTCLDEFWNVVTSFKPLVGLRFAEGIAAKRIRF